MYSKYSSVKVELHCTLYNNNIAINNTKYADSYSYSIIDSALEYTSNEYSE